MSSRLTFDHDLITHSTDRGWARTAKRGTGARFAALASRFVLRRFGLLGCGPRALQRQFDIGSGARGDLGSLPCALRDDFPNARKKTYVKDGPRSSFRLSSSLLGPCHLLPQHPSIQAGPRRVLWRHGPTEEDIDAGIRIGKRLRYQLPGSPGLLRSRVQRSAE